MRSRKWLLLTAALVLMAAYVSAGPQWLENARISSPYDDPAGNASWEDGVRTAIENGANVILDWGGVSDNWKALFEPEQSTAVDELENRAAWIHQTYPGVHYIVYVAPLEYVTEGLDTNGDGLIDAGKENDSLSLQHPEWAQVGIDGRKAVFFGFQPEMPFWVCPSCEDVWVSPAHPEVRAAVVELYRRLAEAGLDGIWLDVPFLMDEFGENWVGQFPDVGSSARTLFELETGMSLPAPPLSPDWNDSSWQEFIAWRYELINGLLDQIASETRTVAPDFALIVESSVAWNNRMTGFGASPVDIPRVASTTAHELGGTERPVSVYAWQFFLAQLQAWRHLDLAHAEASWLLGYVEAGHPYTFDLGLLHAATACLSGFGLHVSGAEDMTTMHDRVLLQKLNAWLEETPGDLRGTTIAPMAKTAVVFSRQSMDYASRASWDLDDYGAGFIAMLMILQEHHIPYEVVDSSQLDRLSDFEVAILPDMRCLSDSGAETIRQWVSNGGRLLSTGKTASQDERGNARSDYALFDVFGVHLEDVEDEDENVFDHSFNLGRSILVPAPHERYYIWEATPEEAVPANTAAAEAESAALMSLYGRFGITPLLQTDAPATVVLLPWETVTGKYLLSAINLTGLNSTTALPDPVIFDLSMAIQRNSGRSGLRFTEILQESHSLEGNWAGDENLSIHIELERGAMVEILPGRLPPDSAGYLDRDPPVDQ